LPASGEPVSQSAGDTAEQPLVGLLYRAMVGPVHTDYYLRQFARFDAAGKAGMSWHWPAFFSALGWLAFRRLWREALLFVGLSATVGLALFSLAALVWGAAPEDLWLLLAGFLLVQSVLPAIWANGLYYRHCNREVTQALAAASDIRQTSERLALKASSRRRAGVVAALAAGLWLLALAAGAWLFSMAAEHDGAASTAAKLTAPAASSPMRPSASAPAMNMAASAATAASAASAATASTAAASAALPASAPASAAAPAQLASAAASAPATALAASAPASAALAAPTPKAVVAPAVPTKPVASAAQGAKRGKFVVAVGQFAKEQNADRAYSKLEAAGLPVHSNTVQTPTGALVLIRVGPFKTLHDARQAAQKIEALGLPAVVMKR
jgi:cell division septation protein DedD